MISVQLPDNAKPMSRRLRSRCRYHSAKPMSKRMRSRCQDECEADVNMIRSLCQGEREADVMSRRRRSRCQGDREADVEKVFTNGITQSAKPMSRRMRSRCQYNAKPRSKRYVLANLCIAPKCYIYIYTQNQDFGRSDNCRFLNRFWRGF